MIGFASRGFLGGGAAAEEAEPDPEPAPGPTPIPVPVVFGDPEYFDHVTRALARMCQQFRGDGL